ncbi:XrtA-associated ATPase [Geomonas sp. Red32]|uniref:XrtA/PEP-CTERM system-associated ATPase n=1 Tax=Geomonas sp. Red32 TaxID=2912856 RepID=UPI00202CA9DA|nr:XrtA/PEP-CTERM system-associated ATPase [Geomonas sp. Red32]MCM0083326.1 XrtA-associated ATPase [Geomonas sp. Red32]
MYTEFFQLKKKPFELLPDPEFIYLSRPHRRALTYLDYGVRQRAGFILLTGDVGSGKTTLIRELIGKNYQRVVLGKLFNTRVSTEQLLAMINDDFGLPVAGKDKVALMRDLNDFLLEQFAAGRQPILIIDEAQNLGEEQLEEVRLLSNLENAQAKLLQIVLVGQPELRTTLALPSLLQLRQRISINCHLRPLNREELAEYVVHRLTVAGNPEAIEFPEPSLDTIFRYTRGIPRLINIFCDFVMLAAFAEESRVAGPEILKDVVEDLDFENHFWSVSERGADEPLELTPLEPLPLVGEQQLADLSRRLETIERENGEQLNVLRELCDTLSTMKDEMDSQVAGYQATARDLRSRMESVSAELRYLELCRSEVHVPAGGLARRLIDGLTGSNGKK